jgi:hypothetical protein
MIAMIIGGAIGIVFFVGFMFIGDKITGGDGRWWR